MDSYLQNLQIQAIRQELANLRGLVALIAEKVGVDPHDVSRFGNCAHFPPGYLTDIHPTSKY